MLTFHVKALIVNHAETEEPVLLFAAADEEQVEAAAAEYRTVMTHVAASPMIEGENYDKAMRAIKSLRIVDVRVTTTEVL